MHSSRAVVANTAEYAANAAAVPVPEGLSTVAVPDMAPDMAPKDEEDANSDELELKYDEPLYVEINIPLPPIPKSISSPAPAPRRKSHSMSSFRPFHRRGSSSDFSQKPVEEWPRIKKEVKSREVAAAMTLTGRHRRIGTIDALAVVPTVLMLSAELFTPGDGEKGRWKDGMI